MTIEQLDKINFGRHSFNVEFLPYLNLGFIENAMELKPLRQSAFLANVIHESGGFTRLEENLNYTSEARIWEIFGHRLKTANRLPSEFVKEPEKIANFVYANRMGNGDEASGDGFKYRGRGLIQLTGKVNYEECSEQIGVDLVTNPKLLKQPEYAVKSAFWFWMNKSLNLFADKKDMKTITLRINGGLNGLNERTKLFERALLILS